MLTITQVNQFLKPHGLNIDRLPGFDKTIIHNSNTHKTTTSSIIPWFLRVSDLEDLVLREYRCEK